MLLSWGKQKANLKRSSVKEEEEEEEEGGGGGEEEEEEDEEEEETLKGYHNYQSFTKYWNHEF